jgi:hypothetical protein
MGSTRIARRAGMYEANMATKHRIAATEPNVTGSAAFTPKSKLEMSRVSAKESARPSTTPTAASRAPFAHDETQSVEPLRAQGRADADFLRSARDGISYDPVKADGGKRQAIVPNKILAKHLEAHRNGFPPEGFIFLWDRNLESR